MADPVCEENGLWKARRRINASVSARQCTRSVSEGPPAENGVLGPENQAASDCFITGPFIDLVALN